MLLEDAGLLAERRRLVLPVMRRTDRELEMILRLCAPSDAQRDRGDNQQSAVTERSRSAYGRRSAPIHVVSSVESIRLNAGYEGFRAHQEIVHRSHKPIGIVAGEIMAPGKLDRSDAGFGGAHLGQR